MLSGAGDPMDLVDRSPGTVVFEGCCFGKPLNQNKDVSSCDRDGLVLFLPVDHGGIENHLLNKFSSLDSKFLLKHISKCK